MYKHGFMALANPESGIEEFSNLNAFVAANDLILRLFNSSVGSEAIHVQNAHELLTRYQFKDEKFVLSVAQEYSN